MAPSTRSKSRKTSTKRKTSTSKRAATSKKTSASKKASTTTAAKSVKPWVPPLQAKHRWSAIAIVLIDKISTWRWRGPANGGPERFICPFCGKNVANKKFDAVRHVETHVEPAMRPWQCHVDRETCEYSSVQLRNLQSHVRAIHPHAPVPRMEVISKELSSPFTMVPMAGVQPAPSLLHTHTSGVGLPYAQFYASASPSVERSHVYASPSPSPERSPIYSSPSPSFERSPVSSSPSTSFERSPFFSPVSPMSSASSWSATSSEYTDTAELPYSMERFLDLSPYGSPPRGYSPAPVDASITGSFASSPSPVYSNISHQASAPSYPPNSAASYALEYDSYEDDSSDSSSVSYPSRSPTPDPSRTIGMLRPATWDPPAFPLRLARWD